MKQDVKEIIVQLCEIPGPAGFEEKVALHTKTLLEPYVDEAWIDVPGNVIGVRKCGRENAKKLLFDAHIDEIGFVVTGVEEGFLRFSKLGGFDARVIPATCVTICTEPQIHGVISVLPPHILKKEDTESNFKLEDLFIDVGLSHDEATRLISPGTHGVVMGGVQSFGDNLIRGKAIDDRAGVAAIIRCLELLDGVELDVDIYVMASVQEEVGSRGAATGTYAISPDYCVVIDVDHVKTPDTKPSETIMELGSGVIVTRGPNMNPKLTEAVIKAAKENDVKHQINVNAESNSGTNARAIQISKSGVATAVLGLPMKYMHSANEVASLDDVESAAKLLSHVAKAMRGGVIS